MRGWIAAGLVVLLTGCASSPVVRKPVVVERYIYVRVSPALTAPCPVAMPRNATVAEALRVARARRASLEACNARLREIAEIEGTSIDPEAQVRFIERALKALGDAAVP